MWNTRCMDPHHKLIFILYDETDLTQSIHFPSPNLNAMKHTILNLSLHNTKGINIITKNSATERNDFGPSLMIRLQISTFFSHWIYVLFKHTLLVISTSLCMMICDIKTHNVHALLWLRQTLFDAENVLLSKCFLLQLMVLSTAQL